MTVRETVTFSPGMAEVLLANAVTMTSGGVDGVPPVPPVVPPPPLVVPPPPLVVPPPPLLVPPPPVVPPPPLVLPPLPSELPPPAVLADGSVTGLEVPLSAEAEPPAFVAVTTTRRVAPAVALVRSKRLLFAPAT